MNFMETKCCVCRMDNCRLPQHQEYSRLLNEEENLRGLEDSAFALMSDAFILDVYGISIRAIYVGIRNKRLGLTDAITDAWNEVWHAPFTYWRDGEYLTYVMGSPINLAGDAIDRPDVQTRNFTGDYNGLVKRILSNLELWPHTDWNKDIRPIFSAWYEWPELKFTSGQRLNRHLSVMGSTLTLCDIANHELHTDRYSRGNHNHMLCMTCQREGYKRVLQALDEKLPV